MFIEPLLVLELNKEVELGLLFELPNKLDVELEFPKMEPLELVVLFVENMINSINLIVHSKKIASVKIFRGLL